jgi:H+/Cl- antiporter ClcA
MKKSYDSSQSPVVNRRVLLFLLLGFIGGGIGALLALFFGIRNWPDARLIILSGIAIGLALAAALAPNLLTPQDREASAPNR